VVVDPFDTPGRWLITTASGAKHLIDSSDPDAPVTVVRIAPGGVIPAAGFELGPLRRDGSPINVSALGHPTNDGPRRGLALGADMILTLESLDPLLAYLTVRHTTPVVSIERLDATAIDEGVPDAE